MTRFPLTAMALTLAVPAMSAAKGQPISPEPLARDYLAGRLIFTSPPEISSDGKHATVVGLIGNGNPMVRCTVSLDQAAGTTETDASWRVASLACK